MGKFNKNKNGRQSNTEKKMFRATCAECGKSCEIPFAPTSGRPVYCRECFARRSGNPAGTERKELFPRSFSPNSFDGNGEIKRRIETIETKIDRLIAKMEEIYPTPKEEEKEISASVAKKDKKEEIEKNKVDLKELVEKAVKPEKKKSEPKTKKKTK